MLSGFDPIGKIQAIYREGDRKVPYALFMNVFNALLEDQTQIIPREPTEGLTEKFRAACMAAHAGVSDPEGRGPDRVREFLQKVYPVWRRRLPEEEFARFEEIVGGQMRERFGRRGRERPGPAEAQVEPGGTTSASSALLERLQIGPGTEETEEAEPAAEEEPPRLAEVEPGTEESAIDALLDRKIAEAAGQEEEEAEEVPMLRVAEPEPPQEAGPEPAEEEEEELPELTLAEQVAEPAGPSIEELLTEQEEIAEQPAEAMPTLRAAEPEPPQEAEPEPAEEEEEELPELALAEQVAELAEPSVEELLAEQREIAEQPAEAMPTLRAAEPEPPQEAEPEPTEEEEEEEFPELAFAEQVAELAEPSIEELLTEQREIAEQPAEALPTLRAAEPEPPEEAEPEPAEEEEEEEFPELVLAEQVAEPAGPSIEELLSEQREIAEQPAEALPPLRAAEPGPSEEAEPEPAEEEEEEEELPELVLAEQVAELAGPSIGEVLTEQQEVAEQPASALPDIFESVDALAEAVKAGQIHVRYTTREADHEWVCYALGDHEVSVKVTRTEGRTYVVLGAAVGYENVAEPQEQVDTLAAEMRYVRMADYAYLREGEDAVYTLKVRPRKTSLACGVPGEADWGQILLQLERLHRELGELVERLES